MGDLPRFGPIACDKEGRDGTSLADCTKVYLPPPGGPLGLVFRIAKDEKGRLYLDHHHGLDGNHRRA